MITLDETTAEIERLQEIIFNIHTVARRHEWGNYLLDSAEGWIYATTKQEVMKGE